MWDCAGKGPAALDSVWCLVEEAFFSLSVSWRQERSNRKWERSWQRISSALLLERRLDTEEQSQISASEIETTALVTLGRLLQPSGQSRAEPKRVWSGQTVEHYLQHTLLPALCKLGSGISFSLWMLIHGLSPSLRLSLGADTTELVAHVWEGLTLFLE